MQLEFQALGTDSWGLKSIRLNWGDASCVVREGSGTKERFDWLENFGQNPWCYYILALNAVYMD